VLGNSARSEVRDAHDFMCWNTGGPYLARTAGGAGWSFVEAQSSVDVLSHSPFWFDWHDTLMCRSTTTERRLRDGGVQLIGAVLPRFP
jgi:hypothetical protein